MHSVNHETLPCQADVLGEVQWTQAGVDLLITFAASTHATPKSPYCRPPQHLNIPMLLVASGWVESEEVVRRQGYHGYLSSESPLPQFLKAIEMTSQRSFYYFADGNVKPLGHFTERQIQILRLIGNGSTDAEIAEALKISQTTVRHHIQILCQKFGLYRRGELTAMAALGGIG
jgi:DNA-binding NarL/FixJ family response regulator